MLWHTCTSPTNRETNARCSVFTVHMEWKKCVGKKEWRLKDPPTHFGPDEHERDQLEQRVHRAAHEERARNAIEHLRLRRM